MSDDQCAPTELGMLNERVRRVADNTTMQQVWLDLKTYSDVVFFIEQEGCTLQEGLRRAVRMGVEALLLERTEVPAIVQDYGPAFVPPPMPGYYIGKTQYSQHELNINTANFNSAPVETEADDFTRIAPPGL